MGQVCQVQQIVALAVTGEPRLLWIQTTNQTEIGNKLVSRNDEDNAYQAVEKPNTWGL